MDNILIVDDNRQIREAIHFFIAELHPEKNIVEASDGLEALNILEKKKIDFVIQDYHMPELRGDEIILTAKEMNLQMPFMIFSMETQAHIIKHLIQDVGCSAFLFKSDPLDELCTACSIVTNELGYISKTAFSIYISQSNEFRNRRISSDKAHEKMMKKEYQALIDIKPELKDVFLVEEEIEERAFEAIKRNKL